MIIPIVHISGMIPVSIIFLNSFKYNGIHKLIVDLTYSLMTQSYPGALPFFLWKILTNLKDQKGRTKLILMNYTSIYKI
jgi:hypothetical protein